MSGKYLLTLYFDGSPTEKLTLSNFASTVGTESIQTPLKFSLFVILQPFAKII